MACMRNGFPWAVSRRRHTKSGMWREEVFGATCAMGLHKMGLGTAGSWGARVGRVDVPMAEITADHKEGSGVVPVRLQSLAEIDEQSSGRMADKDRDELEVVSSGQSAKCEG